MHVLGGAAPGGVGLFPDHFRDKTLAVVQAVAHGEVKTTKTAEWHHPPLHPVLRDEFDEFMERWPVAFEHLL